MHSSTRPNNARSSDPPGARPTPTTPHHDRSHRDRPSSSLPLPSEPASRTHAKDKDTDDPNDPPKPKGKLGSYQMRQNLQFSMETPKFLQQLKAQVGGNTSTRFTGAQAAAGDPDAKRRRAIQGESELDDDGPLVVMPDDSEGGETMDERDLERLRVLHPNAVVDGVAKEEPAVEVQESRAGPPVDPRSGKLLFQAKASGLGGSSATSDAGKQGGAVSVGKKAASAKSDKGRDDKGSTAAFRSAGKTKKKKGGSHLLSFDE